MIDETFIKQCEKAEKIQALRPKFATRIHMFGNIYLCSHQTEYAGKGWGGSYFHCTDHIEDDGLDQQLITGTTAIWLPTQAQLQKMLGYRHPMSAGKNLGRWLENLRAEDYLDKLEWSMESLWLAFVMKEKYGNTWDGETWIKGD